MSKSKTKKTGETVIGIDLGTTYSAVAVHNAEGKAEIVPNKEGERTTPSVVGLKDKPVIGRAAVNALAYRTLAAQRLEDALEIFGLGVELHPASAGAWAGFGEACAYADRAAEAQKCFEKALELLPVDVDLDDAERERLKTQVETTLKRLGG